MLYKGLVWEKRDEHTARITKYIDNETEVVVPETIENLIVVEIGPRAFSDCVRVAEIIFPNCIKAFGSYAFSSCYGLTRTNLPASLEHIDDCAFLGCFDLRKIDIPLEMKPIRLGVDVFDGCFRLDIGALSARLGRIPQRSEDMLNPNLAELVGQCIAYRKACRGERGTLPQEKRERLRCGDWEYALRSAPGGDFAEITGYFGNETELLIPAELNGLRVRRLGDWALQGNETVIRVIIAEGIGEVGAETFWWSSVRDVWIPKSVSSICGNPFVGCHGMKFTIAPDHPCLALMDDCILYDKNKKHLICYSSSPDRTEYKIHDGIESIGDDSFGEAWHLEKLELPETLTKIGYRACHGCDTLKHMDIPKGVTFIGSGAFEDCPSLESVQIADNATYMGKSVFDGDKVLSRVRLPRSIKRIEPYTFRGCKAVPFISIPEGVTWIGEAAFADCECLKAIDCPKSLLQIEEGAFHHCPGLTTVALNDGLVSIGARAFQNNPHLIKVKIPASVTDIGDSAFKDCKNLTLYAPPAVLRKNTRTGSAFHSNPCPSPGVGGVEEYIRTA